MCLLDILNKLKYDIAAIHLNHNWRGKESEQEAKNCEKFAKLRGIKFYSEILSSDIEKSETAAREARYEFFKRCAKKFNSSVVFTAHNFDDNAETVLYRIIKGTGTIGLQGISECRDIFYRPLLATSREEIEKYCAENGLIPNVDSSNTDIKYKRNLIRHKIFPLLQEINPKVKEALNSLSELAREDNEIIAATGNCGLKRQIRNLLAENNIDYDRTKIENIQKFIEENKNSKSGKTMSLTTNLWLFANRNGFEIIKPSSKTAQELHITKEGIYDFDGCTFSIEKCNKIPEKFPNDSDFQAYIETSCIDFTLRYRKDGDKIWPLGSSGSQKLKKYLNEKKIPRHKKNEIVLLCKNSEILWAAGLGLSDKIKVVNRPTHMIKLKI